MNEELKSLIKIQSKLESIEELLYSTNFELKTKRFRRIGIESEIDDFCNYISQTKLKLIKFIDVLEKEEISRLEEKLIKDLS